MANQITVQDKTLAGRSTSFTLDFLTARITVRELIRKRVYEDVHDYNVAMPETFRGLVAPPGAECVPDGYLLRDRLPLDAEEQASRALAMFQQNGFLILVDDRQVETLDEEIELQAGTEIIFLKLVPLVGG